MATNERLRAHRKRSWRCRELYADTVNLGISSDYVTKCYKQGEKMSKRNSLIEMLAAQRTIFILSMILVFGLGLGIAAGVHVVFTKGSFWADLFHEIGHALVVASVLGVTVDLYARKRHELVAEEITRKINTDVIGAIYGQQFPAKIRAEVQKSFLEQRIHREDLDVTYSFSLLEGNSERLLVHEQSSFVFVNSSDQAVSLKLQAFVECPMEEALRPHCKMVSASIDGESVAEEELMGAFFDDGMELRWAKDINIPARGRVKVSSACQTVKYMRDVETWSTLYPSDGITLSVSLDAPLNVSAKCVNSGVLKQEVDTVHYKRWKLDNGLFPGQALTFWWNPRGAEKALQEPKIEEKA